MTLRNRAAIVGVGESDIGRLPHMSGLGLNAQAARRALEHAAAELPLGLDDLLADGAGRHAKLVGGLLQRAQPARGLQRPEPVEVDAIELMHIVFL